jgi:hypothetical protein
MDELLEWIPGRQNEKLDLWMRRIHQLLSDPARRRELQQNFELLHSEPLLGAIQRRCEELVLEGRVRDAVATFADWDQRLPRHEAAKDAIRFTCLKGLAYSQLTSVQLTSQVFEFLQDTFQRALRGAGWRDRLTLREMGAAMERSGLLVPTLRFYEQTEGEVGDDDRDWVRRRWIATKRRQIEYYRSQGESRRGDLSGAEHLLTRRQREWTMPAFEPIPDYPVLTTASPAAPAPRRAEPVIEGLPAEIPMHRPASNIQRFTIGEHEVTIYAARARVQISNVEGDSVTIDLVTGDVAGNTPVERHVAESEIRFTVAPNIAGRVQISDRCVDVTFPSVSFRVRFPGAD